MTPKHAPLPPLAAKVTVVQEGAWLIGHAAVSGLGLDRPLRLELRVEEITFRAYRGVGERSHVDAFAGWVEAEAVRLGERLLRAVP